MHAGKQDVAQPSDVLQVGDVVICAATRPQLEKLRDLVGVESSIRLDEVDSPVVARDMPVTRPRVCRKHIADLHIHHLYGVTIARVNRAGIDLASAPGVKLQFGDDITCVGEDRLRQVEAIVGNHTSALQHSQIIPIFVGITLGVLLGSIPVFSVPAPLSLGLAGGPVVVAIVLARIGAIGPLHWNMPPDTIDTVRKTWRVVVHGLCRHLRRQELSRYCAERRWAAVDGVCRVDHLHPDLPGRTGGARPRQGQLPEPVGRAGGQRDCRRPCPSRTRSIRRRRNPPDVQPFTR